MAVAVELQNGARVRARSISIKRLAKSELARGAHEFPPAINAEHPRPATFAQCESEGLGTTANPCPFVSCGWHMYLSVSPTSGAIKINFPHLEPWQLEETCALRVANDGEHTLEELGHLTNLTRERIRQLEAKAFRILSGGAVHLMEDVRHA